MSADSPLAILDPPTLEEVEEAELEYLKAIPGLVVTDWHSGAVLHTIYRVDAKVLWDLVSNALPAVANGGVLGFSTGDWLTMLAKHWFKIRKSWSIDGVQFANITAVQTLTLFCDGSHGPYTIVSGAPWFRGRTGNLWNGITGGTLSTGDSLQIQIQAEGPGAKYNDPAGTIRTMIDALPGVTCSNVAADFSPMILIGSSTGAVAASRTSGGTTPTPKTFRIRIDASGQVTAGAWSYSTDGGVTYVSAGAIVASYALPGGTTIAFTNGAANPSFLVGDIFAFATPGSSIIVPGSDPEGDNSITSRCRARWPDLSAIPAEDRAIKWAKAASTEVLRAKIGPDPLMAGKFQVTLAGAAGGVSGGVLGDVQAYFDKRTGIGRIYEAVSATAQEILAEGIISGPASEKTAILARAQTAWQDYLATTDVGGVIRLAKLVEIVMDAGAVDFEAATINGEVDRALYLDPAQVAVLPAATPLLSQSLTWRDT